MLQLLPLLPKGGYLELRLKKQIPISFTKRHPDNARRI
jgi:hypothetical protein